MALFTKASERRKARRMARVVPDSSSPTGFSSDIDGSPASASAAGSGGGGGGGGGTSSGIAASPIPPPPFPEFEPVEFSEIEKAEYNPVDIIDFAKTFGQFNREELEKNFSQAQKFSLQALDTELKGLESFAPAASALSRELSSVDNQVNQARRNAQIEATLPDAKNTFANLGRTLRAQAKRAERYSSGRLLSDIEDRALELNIRSRAADMSNMSGIGPRSGQARKLSDLMSAEARLGISQYGEGLIGENVGQQEQLIREEANLLLAPTVYSDTGRQVRPTPEVGAGRLTFQGYGAANEATLVSPGQALQTETQQRQFDTSLEQRTREFNATGKFSAETFNANGIFQSKVGQFQSEVAFNSAVTAANQAELNFAAALELQGLQQQGFFQGLGTGQAAQQTQAIGQAIGASAGVAGGIVDILSPNNAPVSSGEAVGSTSIDTSPSGTTGSAPELDLQSTDAGDLDFGADAEAVPSGGVLQGTSPGTYQLSPGSSMPAGFSPVSTDPDGSVIAARSADYNGDLERFARFSKSSQPVRISDAVSMDRAISSAAGLAYIPIQGFQPVASTNSGRTVYSEPGIAASGDVSIGGGKVEAAVLAAAQLGVDDISMYDAMITTGNTAVNRDLQAELDTLYASGGEGAVGQRILEAVGGEHLNTDSDASKKLAFGAMRIGELWPNLSPAQRSLAISSLTPTAVEAKTGKALSGQAVPGTKDAVSGPLTVGDAITVTSRGRNGFALARNWNQLSALGDMLGASKPGAVAAVADTAGFLGFGPEGAAVNIPPEYLDRVGARPAPEMGVGALIFGTAKQVPRDYEVISEVPGGILALPKNMRTTSTVSSSAPKPLAFRRAQEVAAGKHPVQKFWASKPGKHAIRGAVGGSAIVSGMSTLIAANPSLAGSITAYSLFNNSMGTA